MQLTSAKRGTDGLPLGWRWMWLGLGLLLAAWPACGLGQDYSPSEIMEETPADGPFGEQFSGRSGRAFGGLVRGGFVTGPGIGRDDGFAPLELMPYFSVGEGMILGDLRGFRSTSDHYGFNTGLGYRQYVRGWDRILGFNAFYDYDNTSTQLFRQIGFGLETFGELWDMRLNTYFPVTDDTKQLDLEFLPESLRYSGNNILFDQIRTFGVHMKGVDHEIGVPLPGRIPERHRVRAYAGWYHFQGRDVDNAFGWKGRLQGDLTGNINMGLEVTHDAIFDTNVIFSVAVSYGGFKQRDGEKINQYDRMTTPIQRQYTAVVQKNPVLESGLVALKPDGTPYFVEHVASEPPYNRNNTRFDLTAPLGTFENPFFTIQEAQAVAGGDIIFTWTNSQFDNLPVTIESGVQTLGEADGVVHTFLLQPFGFVDLPRANNNLDPNVAELRPLLTFSDRTTIVDAVTLSSGIALLDESVIRSEFSGFRIGDVNVARPDLTGATGNGIVGQNVTGVTADQNQINFAQGDGILLTGVGDVTFFNTQVLNAAGTGLHVQGGQPRVVFEGDPGDSIAELTYDTSLFPNVPQVPGGHAVIVEGTQAGSLVDLFGTSPSAIDYTNAGGILIQNANGSARFGDVTLTDTFVQNLPQPLGSTFQGAINIFNSTAAYTFAGPVSIDTPDVDAIVIERMSGQSTFQDAVVVTDRVSRALNFFSNSGNILFTDTDTGVVIDALVDSTAVDPAVQYLASSGDVTFIGNLTIGRNNVVGGVLDPNNVSGSGQAIVIGGTSVDPLTGLPNDDNTGTFEVNGGTSIRGYQGTNLLIINDQSTVLFDDFSIDQRGVALQRNDNPAVLIQEMAGPVRFTGITNVGNTNIFAGASLDVAVSLVDNSGDISFNELTISDASAVIFANQVAGLQVLGTPIFGDNATPNDPSDDTVIVGSTYTGEVSINTLNITSTDGKALFAQFAGDQFNDPLDP
ncbi:MAG TPA: inverse autotransporter beta domain-containing protein, partial [Planctomycetaceae bacterium]|nr:inverse autotransporter beta domain-containing protein [Planctomycetaceae bacterium]